MMARPVCSDDDSQKLQFGEKVVQATEVRGIVAALEERWQLNGFVSVFRAAYKCCYDKDPFSMPACLKRFNDDVQQYKKSGGSWLPFYVLRQYFGPEPPALE